MSAIDLRISIGAACEVLLRGGIRGQAAVDWVGFWAHLPTCQAWITGEAAFDWLTGEDVDRGPARPPVSAAIEERAQ